LEGKKKQKKKKNQLVEPLYPFFALGTEPVPESPWFSDIFQRANWLLGVTMVSWGSPGRIAVE